MPNEEEIKRPETNENNTDKLENIDLEPTKNGSDALFLISTDSFSNSGLDIVFEMSKSAWFDGIDLAMRKNFDAWNVSYVKKLSKKHDMPIKVVQVSESVNEKELNKALDICEATWADTITINAPTYFDLKTYDFIKDNIGSYIEQNPQIHFAIINPQDSNMFALPIPKYHFTNIVEIIKKYWCYLWLDIANLDVNALENEFLRKLSNLVPYVATVYFSDKDRLGNPHILPWEGSLRLPTILKKIKQTGFSRYFSSKINISKSELADSDKVEELLIKAREYYKKHYEEIEKEDE